MRSPASACVADSVTLNDENRQQVTQDFTEVELHAGLGAELRFKWFGIEADARYIGLWRDDSDRRRATTATAGRARAVVQPGRAGQSVPQPVVLAAPASRLNLRSIFSNVG